MGKRIFTDEERKEKNRARARAWRAAHPEESKGYQAKRCKTKKAEYQARWVAEHPNQNKATKNRYRDKQAKPRILLTPEQRVDRNRETARRSAIKNREARVAQTRAWRKANSEKVKANNRKWRSTNRNRHRAVSRLWKLAHPEATRALRAARRAREGDGGGYTAADVIRLQRLQRGKCAYCLVRLKRDYHVDHIKPLARRGTNGPRNIQLLCPPCNWSKHAKDPIDFAQEIGLLL